MKKNDSWKTHTTEVIYQNKHIAFRKDTVTTPTGIPGEYGVVERPFGVFIVAMKPNHSICLIRQFRYPTQLSTWEVPAGGAETTESRLETAQRELAEEAKLTAGDWQSLGTFFLAPGYSSESAEVFLAQRLHTIDYAGNDPDEGIEDRRFFSLTDIADLMQSTTPFDGPTITAISMACVRLGLKIR